MRELVLTALLPPTFWLGPCREGTCRCFSGRVVFFLMLLILYSPFSRSTPKSFAFLVTGDSSISYGSTLAVRLTHVEECSQAEFFPANKVVRRHDFVVSFPGSVLGAI